MSVSKYPIVFLDAVVITDRTEQQMAVIIVIRPDVNKEYVLMFEAGFNPKTMKFDTWVFHMSGTPNEMLAYRSKRFLNREWWPLLQDENVLTLFGQTDDYVNENIDDIEEILAE